MPNLTIKLTEIVMMKLSTKRLNCTLSQQKGSVLIESLIIIPLLILLTLGILQYTFIYHAKSALDYATFMSARAGAVNNINKNSILSAFIFSLKPLYAHVSSSDENLSNEIVNDITRYTNIQIVNPTREAFQDFAVVNKNNKEIPNNRLYVAPIFRGQRSQMNIQDANILKLRIIYGLQLKIPFVNTIIIKAASIFMKKPDHEEYLKNNRLPISSTAIVRMQSPAVYNSWVQGRFK